MRGRINSHNDIDSTQLGGSASAEREENLTESHFVGFGWNRGDASRAMLPCPRGAGVAGLTAPRGKSWHTRVAPPNIRAGPEQTLPGGSDIAALAQEDHDSKVSDSLVY